jgi:hypothetical protein
MQRFASLAAKQCLPAVRQQSAFSLPALQPQQKALLLTNAKRGMSVLSAVKLKALLPVDTRFQDDEVISVYNKKTGLVEPIIMAVPETSFEWVFSSPCDLHTFDVIPVIKDCVDPVNPTFEGMDG